MGFLVDSAHHSQRVAAALSVVLSFVAMVLGFVWGQTDNPDTLPLPAGYLGGFSDPGTLHAVLMIFAFGFCQAVALMSYRALSYFSHRIRKIIHGGFHALTVACVVTALVFIVQDHNNNGEGHLASLHSWLGVLLLAVFSQNFTLGFLSFALPKDGSPSRLKWAASYLPSHRFLGLVTSFLGALVMCTGILQEAWGNGGGCIYPNTDPQLDPIAGYTSVPPGCRLGNAIGVLVAVNAAMGCYALVDLSHGTDAETANHLRGEPRPEGKVELTRSAGMLEVDDGGHGGSGLGIAANSVRRPEMAI